MLPRQLRAFATGEDQQPALEQLRTAELSKHKLLLAAVMRMGVTAAPEDYQRALAIPYELLSEIERRAPQVVRDVISCPQFGAWADSCLRRLLAPAAGAGADAPPLACELGHLSVFAAAAAVRSGQVTDELDIPLRRGQVTFPAVGTARPGSATDWEWARIIVHGSGLSVRSTVSAVRLHEIPCRPEGAEGAWSAAPQIVVESGGLRFAVLLDSCDPYLDRYGTARVPVNAQSLARWQQMTSQAWQILTEAHPRLARCVAATVNTVVPLARPGPTRSSSSTDIASFGAVGLSLPGDALSMAEALVHEAHHAILGAMTDIVPLVRQDAAYLAYAPWRDDPRPGSALLQGVFAHYGMSRFWAERHTVGSPAQRRRASAEFARLRMITSRAADTLTRSGLLTEAGDAFVSDIRAQLTAWLEQPLPSRSIEYALDASTDHEVRWRLRYLSPDPLVVASVADAWRRGRPPPALPPQAPGQLTPTQPPAPASANTRDYLLSLRYRDPGELRRWLSAGSTESAGTTGPGRADPADAALAEGRYSAAARGYLRRIAAGADLDAWVGLAVSRRRTGPSALAALLVNRPEVVVAVHDRLSAAARVDPDQLATWLAGVS